MIDLGMKRVPIEVKAGQSVASDFLAGLDRYAAMSGDAEGILVYGGTESYRRRGHHVRAWSACS